MRRPFPGTHPIARRERDFRTQPAPHSHYAGSIPGECGPLSSNVAHTGSPARHIAAEVLHLFIYLLFAYTAVAVASVILATAVTRHAAADPPGEPHGRPTRRWRPAMLLAALLPLLPYAAVEAQTHLYLPALRGAVADAVQEINGAPTFRSAKVLGITQRSCRVYVVTPCLAAAALGSGWRGEVLRLSRSGAGWSYTGVETVWSDCGSASGNIFPPYPSKGDYP